MYLVYEVNSNDLCCKVGCKQVEIMGLYKTLERARQEVEEIIEVALEDDYRENIKRSNEHFRVMQDRFNYDQYFEIWVDKVEVE